MIWRTIQVINSSLLTISVKFCRVIVYARPLELCTAPSTKIFCLSEEPNTNTNCLPNPGQNVPKAVSTSSICSHVAPLIVPSLYKHVWDSLSHKTITARHNSSGPAHLAYYNRGSDDEGQDNKQALFVTKKKPTVSTSFRTFSSSVEAPGTTLSISLIVSTAKSKGPDFLEIPSFSF